MEKNHKRSVAIVSLVCLAAVIVLCLVALGRSSPAELGGPQRKPDIILMSIDTLRADHLSCYGYSRKTSPVIDEFARESVIFMNAMTQVPKTAPAHMSIFTGLTHMVHRVHNVGRDGNYRALGKDFVTLPEVLKKNGYTTVGLTGGGNVSGYLGFDRGFDLYSSTAVRWSAIFGETETLNPIREWIDRSRQDDSPLFLFLHNYLCHDPYVKAPKRFQDRFLKNRVPGLPLDRADISHDKDFWVRQKSFWKNVDLNNPEHREHIIALYDAGVFYADYVFGKILDILKEKGLYDDSLIVLVSDHGEEFHEHLKKTHGQLFVENMHVPLIVKFPGGRYAGTSVGANVRTLDLMPTLLQLAGIETDHFMQGVSLMPLLAGTGEYDPILIGYSENLRHMRFQQGDMVYLNQENPAGNEWLFDLAHDPDEKNNLLEQQPGTARHLKTAGRRLKKADRVLSETYTFDASQKFEVDEETKDRLRALGYMK